MGLTSLISSVIWIFFAYLYPSYESFKAIHTKNFKKLTRLLVFWIVVALFSAFQPFADLLLSWFPFYSEAKLLFILFLLFPEGRGAIYIYKTYALPYFLQNEERFDNALLEMQSNMGHISAGMLKQATVFVRQALAEAIRRGQELFIQQMMNPPSTPSSSSTSLPFPSTPQRDHQAEVAKITELLEGDDDPHSLPSSSERTLTFLSTSTIETVHPTLTPLPPSPSIVLSPSPSSLPQPRLSAELPRLPPRPQAAASSPSQTSLPSPSPPPGSSPDQRKDFVTADKKEYEAMVRDWVWEIEQYDGTNPFTNNDPGQPQASAHPLSSLFSTFFPSYSESAAAPSLPPAPPPSSAAALPQSISAPLSSSSSSSSSFAETLKDKGKEKVGEAPDQNPGLKRREPKDKKLPEQPARFYSEGSNQVKKPKEEKTKSSYWFW